MTQIARIRAYVTALPSGTSVTAGRVAYALDIAPTSAGVALRRLSLKGVVVRQPREGDLPVVYEVP